MRAPVFGSAVILILVVVLVLIAVLVAAVVLILVLVLILIVILILVLVIHFYSSIFMHSRSFRLLSIPNSLGLILCFEQEAR